MKKIPFKYNREGAWSSSHPFHYRCAYEVFADFEKLIQTLNEKEIEIQNENPEMDPEELWSYIHYETDELWHEAYKLATMVRLFACMAIEAFLNNYGTKCLGENFYKQNMERLRITQKIAVLIASCKNNLIDKNDPLIKKVQTFFEARNQLVHPKSREIDFDRIDDFSNKNPKELKIIEIIEDMEQILSQICEMDPDINFDIEFPKPNKANSADAKSRAAD